MHCLLGPERRRQVDADQVRLRRGRADQRRDPLPGRAAARRATRRARSSAASRRSTRSSTSSPDLSVAESIFLAHEPRRGPLLDLDKMYRESAALLARLGHESIPVRAKVGRAAAGGAADRLDRARAVGQRAAADHGRAVRDPRRRRDRDALRRRSPAHRRGRRRRLHLAPPRRDPAHRRPRHRAGRRAHDGDRPARRRRRPTSSSSSWSGARSISSIRSGRSAPTASCSRCADAQAAPRRARREPAGSRGRGRRPRRARRLRAHRAAPASSTASTSPTRARSWSRASRCAPGRPRHAIRPGLGLAPEDRKSQALVLDWSQTKNVTHRRPRPLLARAARTSARSASARASSCRALNTVPDDPDRDRAAALGRQPAEGRARTLAAARVPRAAARRADARRRRRDEGRDLPDHQRPRRSRASACSSSRPSSRSSSHICTRVLVMREGEIVAEVDGKDATERELLRHAVAPTDAPVLAEEVV